LKEDWVAVLSHDEEIREEFAGYFLTKKWSKAD
jgi:hypothetical protein